MAKKMNRLTKRILMEIAIMVALVVLLVVMIGNVWASYEVPEGTQPPEEPGTTAGSTPAGSEGPLGIENFLTANNLTEADYPAWLLRELDIEAENASFILNYPLRDQSGVAADLVGVDSSAVPALLQWDERWGYEEYAGELIGISGAGPTCLSMVAYYLTSDTSYTPAYFAQYAQMNGYALERGGTDWSLFTEGAVNLGFRVTEVPNVKGAVEQYLVAGIPVVVHVGEGKYTDSGHYMVLVGTENGGIVVHDPNSPKNTETTQSWADISDCALKFWAIQK